MVLASESPDEILKCDQESYCSADDAVQGGLETAEELQHVK